MSKHTYEFDEVEALQQCDRCLAMCSPGLACVSNRPGHADADSPCRPYTLTVAADWCLCGFVDDRGGICGNCGLRIMTDDDALTTPPEQTTATGGDGRG